MTAKRTRKLPQCTNCDDTGIAVYPLRLCGDCDAGKRAGDKSDAMNDLLLVADANASSVSEIPKPNPRKKVRRGK